MTTYTIRGRYGGWQIYTDDKPVVWLVHKYEAEAWVAAQDAQEDRGDVARELRAIRKSLDNLPGKMASAFGLLVLLFVALALMAGVMLERLGDVEGLPPQPKPPSPIHREEFHAPAGAFCVTHFTKGDCRAR